jgi:hypothetical protein
MSVWHRIRLGTSKVYLLRKLDEGLNEPLSLCCSPQLSIPGREVGEYLLGVRCNKAPF